MASTLLSGLGAGAVAHAAPGAVTVYAGYADSLRPAPNFPVPWAGDPGVIFEGCQPAATCTFDSSAVRVANDSATTINVGNLSIDIAGCVFRMWPGATLAPGQNLIITQTANKTSEGTGGCPGPSPVTGPALVDGSDIGPGGRPNAGNCTQDGVIPTVDMSLNATPQHYVDNGQVLNTHGIDQGKCPPGTNESIQWTPIGTFTPPAPAPTMTGRAYGLSASAKVLGVQTVNVPPIPDTGAVSTNTDSTTPGNCVATLGGTVSATVLCSGVTTATGPRATSTATASVATANVGSIAGLPPIAARVVQSRSSTTCAGSSGSTTIAFLQVGAVVVNIPSPIPANYKPLDAILNVPGASLILNEQVPVPGGLTVNAIHLKLHTSLGTDVDVVVASSTSDIHGC